MATTITLPPERELLARLKGVSNDPDLVQHYYPGFAKKYAGRRVEGGNVVNLLVVDSYLFPGSMKKVIQLLRQFVEALVDDERVTADAMAHIVKVETKLLEL